MEVNEWQLDPAKANELRKQIPHENILLMRKIIKINRKNKGQERTIVMTNTSLFNLQKTTVKRTIRIPCIEAISISINSNEMVLHVPSQYDYRYECPYRDEFIYCLLEARQLHIKLKEDLMIFVLKDKQLDAVTTNEEDAKKGKRKVPNERPKYVNLKNMAYIIYQYLMEANNEQLLFMSADLHLNYKKPDLQKLVKIGLNHVSQVYLARCMTTKNIYVIRQLRKQHLTAPVETFRDLLLSYENNKFCMKLVCAVEKPHSFQLTFNSYNGDLYGQMAVLSEFDEDIIRHIVIRLILAIQNIKEVFVQLIPENVVVDPEGNTFLAFFSSYIRCQLPLEYLSPEEYVSLKEDKPVADARMTNLWKIAIIAYELAYGVTPFDSKTLLRIAFKNEDVQVRYPRMNAKSIYFREFMELVLKKDPKERCGATNFLQELSKTEWLKNTNWDTYRRSNVTTRKYLKCLKLQQNFVGESNIEYLY